MRRIRTPTRDRRRKTVFSFVIGSTDGDGGNIFIVGNNFDVASDKFAEDNKGVVEDGEFGNTNSEFSVVGSGEGEEGELV